MQKFYCCCFQQILLMSIVHTNKEQPGNWPTFFELSSKANVFLAKKSFFQRYLNLANFCCYLQIHKHSLQHRLNTNFGTESEYPQVASLSKLTGSLCLSFLYKWQVKMSLIIHSNRRQTNNSKMMLPLAWLASSCPDQLWINSAQSCSSSHLIHETSPFPQST